MKAMDDRPSPAKRSLFLGYHLGIALVVILGIVLVYKLRQREEPDETPDHGLAALSALTREDLAGRWNVYESSIDYAVKQASQGNLEAIRCVVHLQSLRTDATLGDRTFAVAAAHPDLLYKVLDEHSDAVALSFLDGLSRQCWERAASNGISEAKVRIQARICETEEEQNAYMVKWLTECFEEDKQTSVEEVRSVCSTALAYIRRRWGKPEGKREK